MDYRDYEDVARALTAQKKPIPYPVIPGGTTSTGTRSVSVSGAPPGTIPRSSNDLFEVAKGLTSGSTGELADLASHLLLGSDVIEPEPGLNLPYKIGYGVGMMAGWPQHLAAGATRLVGSRLLPIASPWVKAAVSNALTNAALAGVSAAGQGKDIGQAVSEAAEWGGVLGGIGAKAGPAINRMVGRTIIAPYEATEAAALAAAKEKGPIGKAAEKVASFFRKKPPGMTAEEWQNAWKKTGGVPPVGKTPAEWEQAWRQAGATPPPKMTTPEWQEAWRKAGMPSPAGKSPAEWEEAWKQAGIPTPPPDIDWLFPQRSEDTSWLFREGTQAPSEARTSFFDGVRNRIRSAISGHFDQFREGNIDLSDFEQYANDYLESKIQGIPFPKVKDPFKVQIRNLIDKAYEKEAQAFKQGTRAPKPPPRTAPDILPPEESQLKPPLVSPKTVAREAALQERPTTPWIVTPEGEVSTPSSVRNMLPSVYRRVPAGVPLRTPAELQIPAFPQVGVPATAQPRLSTSESPINPFAERIPPVPPGVRPLRLTDQAPEYVWAEALSPEGLPPSWRRTTPEPPQAEALPPEALVTSPKAAPKQTVTIAPEEEELAPLPVSELTPEQRTVLKNAGGKALAALKYIKDKAGIRRDQQLTQQHIEERIAYENLGRGHKGKFEEKLRLAEELTRDPDVLALLKPAEANEIRNLVSMWEQVQAKTPTLPAAPTTTTTPTSLSKATSPALKVPVENVSAIVKKLQGQGKSSKQIAVELAARLHKNIQAGIVEQKRYGTIPTGEFAGLTALKKEGQMQGAGSEIVNAKALGEAISNLVGPEQGNRLINFVYSKAEETPKEILSKGLDILKGGTPESSEMRTDINNLWRQLGYKGGRDVREAIFTELKGKYGALLTPNIIAEEMGEPVSGKIGTVREKISARGKQIYTKMSGPDDKI